VAWTFFDDVLDALVGFLPAAHRSFSSKKTWLGLKVWFGPEPREHFEVQFLGRRGEKLEIGFHAEHREQSKNEEVLERLLAAEPKWRPALGDEAKAGKFLGRQSPWRRLSEVWEGDDLLGPETAIEAAERLADYVRVLVPLLSPPRAPRRAAPA
jgi:hypothetical protein